MIEQQLEPGQIVQLNPATVRNQAFAGCFMTVTEPKSFGAQGYIQALGDGFDKPGGQAYYRAHWDEMEAIANGRAVWMAA